MRLEEKERGGGFLAERGEEKEKKRPNEPLVGEVDVVVRGKNGGAVMAAKEKSSGGQGVLLARRKKSWLFLKKRKKTASPRTKTEETSTPRRSEGGKKDTPLPVRRGKKKEA